MSYYSNAPIPTKNWQRLAQTIKFWGRSLGFQDIAITDLDLNKNTVSHLHQWLQKGYHGQMAYMARNIDLRTNPKKLVKNAQRAIVVRIDYLTDNPEFTVVEKPDMANISRYALGKDYHKLIRKRLKQLATKIEHHIGHAVIYRPFADSAPIMEKPLAVKAGLGWQGKHTNLIHPKAGSWFFLGVLLIDLPLPTDPIFQTTHCGSCTACISACPTKAIVAPYQLDARRCISYLTIELKESIPVEFRPLIGNRIYGCDDCQLVCPWNKFAKTAQEMTFHDQHGLKHIGLTEVFKWDETTFLKKTEGSAIRRIGYQRWLRNIATALGNAPTTTKTIIALKSRQYDDSPLVREHVEWALAQHCSG